MKLKMNHSSLTGEEARILCLKSQHLIGHPLNPQIRAHGQIEHVVVVPFGDHARQKQFVESLLDGTPASGDTYATDEEYAVLVVGRPLRWVQQSILILDVRTYQSVMATRSAHRRVQRAAVAV